MSAAALAALKHSRLQREIPVRGWAYRLGAARHCSHIRSGGIAERGGPGGDRPSRLWASGRAINVGGYPWLLCLSRWDEIKRT